jgi:hypothetical protein|tara:strand:- start:306 stop:560 length:255 start_codon:yes stop_codon:yes gene_type:complete
MNMAFAKKTREEWDAEAKAKNLQKAVDNIDMVKQIAKAADIGANSKTDALIMILISEVMNLNNNLYWINHALKKSKTSSDNVPF